MLLRGKNLIKSNPYIPLCNVAIKLKPILFLKSNGYSFSCGLMLVGRFHFNFALALPPIWRKAEKGLGKG